MSAKSEAYHGIRSRDLEFLHNWALRNTFYCDPKNILPDDHYGKHFSGFPNGLLGSTGADVAASSLTFLLWWTGAYENSPIALRPADPGAGIDAQPYMDPYAMGVYQNQWTWVTADQFTVRRPFYKARRTYWTGAPRRRRNLPT